MKSIERFEWAIEVMAIKPADQVLGIGCGAGIAVSLIADQLRSGRITAVDSSGVQLKRAALRNADAIQAGKVLLLKASFATLKLDPHSFDRVFAFNVGQFIFKDPVKELALIKQVLKKKGHFYLFYQAPYKMDATAADRPKALLEKNGFVVKKVIFKTIGDGNCFCIISTSGPPPKEGL